MPSLLAIKVDVDTERGTREGVLPLAELLSQYKCPATFLFSLGPDNTGKAIRRIFRKGFISKVRRTNVAGNYGLRTLLNGTLLPAPHIGKRNGPIIQSVKNAGFETGIHCYDHFRWQDYLHSMSLKQIRDEFGKAVEEYKRLLGEEPLSAGAPGWQANAMSLQVYDENQLLWGSDTRGFFPFFPKIGNQIFKTIQIPSTLPTLDELMGLPEFPEEKLVPHYLSLIKSEGLHIHTIHAEMEGMRYLSFFREFLAKACDQGIAFVSLNQIAHNALAQKENVPVCEVVNGEVPGRSGTLALQKKH